MKHDARHRAFLRVMQADDVPKDGNAILLCHKCQWRARFAGSVTFLALDAIDKETGNTHPLRLIWRR